MFAFAIWDENTEDLFLARDRLGQKPLFYRRKSETLWFGSTIKNILADKAVEAKPDLDAIREYLVYQYTPTPATGFEGIHQLEPGCYLRFSEDGTEKHRYWDVSFAGQSTASPSQLATNVRSNLKEATKLRMRSDVPVGVFLSGGIDSSLVTGLMSELSEDPIETYSISFDEEAYNELEFAKIVADHFETNHHEYTVSPDAMDVLPELVEHYEMPFADSSALPTYYVSEIASQDVTVALSGDAGDENFAGYQRYTREKILRQLSRIPDPAIRGIQAGSSHLSNLTQDRQMIEKATKAMEIAGKDPVERYAGLVTHSSDEELPQVWKGSEGDAFKYLQRAFSEADGPTHLDQILQVDLNTYLPNDILVKVDRASMAHSLEVRSPFLDHKVVEQAARIPAKYKWRRGNKKWILKQASRI